ncbi:MAG: lysostaphin resistance A-like protein [Promethearchaeota archaeon]
MAAIQQDKNEKLSPQFQKSSKNPKRKIITGIIGTIIWILFIIGFFFQDYALPFFSFPSEFSKAYFYFGFYLFILGGFICISLLLPLDFGWKDLKLNIPKKSPILDLKVMFFILIAMLIISSGIIVLFNRGTVGYSPDDIFAIPRPLFILWAIIIAPIFEEIFFREIIVEFGGRFLKKKTVYVISSLIFSIMHFGIIHGGNGTILITFIFAILLSTLRNLSDSILPCIVTHFLFNLIAHLFLTLPNFEFLEYIGRPFFLK